MHVTSDPQDVVEVYPFEYEVSALIILDSEFMVDGRPKYNELLSIYQDRKFDPGLNMFMDGELASTPHRATIIQINSKAKSRKAALLGELGLLMASSSSAMSSALLRQYASAVSLETIDNDTVKKDTEIRRQQLFSCMFPGK